MLNQSLQQKMLQKLSPQQILLMKLLQIPSMALEQRIKEEIEENPVLEFEDGEGETDSTTDEYDDYSQDESGESRSGDDIDINDYLDEDDIPSYKLYENNQSADDEYRESPLASVTSFHESLMTQLGMRYLTDKQEIIGTTIIGNIDEAGYLQRDIESMVDDLAFTQGISTSKAEIEEILSVVREFEPAGVGARNLQECLLLQLQKGEQTESVKLAILLLDKYFEDFIRKRYDKIQKRVHLTEDELRGAISEILKLNPKPGNSVSDSGRLNPTIVPDFTILVKDNELELLLNQRNMPELRLSRTYIDMLEGYNENKNHQAQSQRDAILFIKQKIDSAKWFIDAIKQRHNTLFTTMQAIMEYQKEYFLQGDETLLRPMILKDIAEKVNLDISTISRVANSKYVQTPYGTFLLKSFFSESIQNEQGEEISTREIKKILSDCIEAEDKAEPLTDEELTVILKEKGYPIARRTVAKYREQLDISVARLRKLL